MRTAIITQYFPYLGLPVGMKPLSERDENEYFLTGILDLPGI